MYSPIRGAIQRQIWSVQMSDGARLIEGGGMANYRIADIFKAIFLMRHMSNIVAWTSQNLELLNKPYKTEIEILRFFGSLILETRFQFNNRRDLWSSSPSSKYKHAATFSKTRISRD